MLIVLQCGLSLLVPSCDIALINRIFGTTIANKVPFHRYLVGKPNHFAQQLNLQYIIVTLPISVN